MTSKEYLSQAYRIDRVIKAKLEQVQSLEELATTASATLSDTPRSETRNVHRMEDIIVEIVVMKDEVLEDIATLVSLKRDISDAIRGVESEDYRVLLELRYLCFKTWNAIATDMKYSEPRIYQIHAAALKKISVPKTL